MKRNELKRKSTVSEPKINPNISGTPLDNGWEVFASNPGPNPITLEATAKCAKLVDVP